jgi:hypothetical protein
VLRKLREDDENYTVGTYIICDIPFVVTVRVIKSKMLREARCTLCGKNERFLKIIVGKLKGEE